MSNKNIKNTNLTSDNSSFLRSVSKETKDHFDNLLKKALHKNDKLKKGSNNQNRNTNIQKSTSGEEIKTDTKKVLNENNPNTENFILEKFLSDAVNSKKNKNPEQLPLTKIPIPLPRKLKTKNVEPTSPASQGTYSISSPVLQNADLLNDFDKISTCSKDTYNVVNPEVVTNSKNDIDNISNSSKGTYNIFNNEKQVIKDNSADIVSNDESGTPVGDILFHHNTPKSKSLVKVVNKRKDSTSTNTSKNSKIHYENEQQNLTKRSKTSSEDEQTIKAVSLEPEKSNEKVELNDLYIRKRKENKIKGRLTEKRKNKKCLLSYQDLIGVVVYKTDKLLLNSLIHHPCVKIHVVDCETGEYLRKSKESGGDDNNAQKVKYILPLITKSYELQKNRSLVPNWDELIVFEEDFDYLMENKESIIIFFEILDFLSFSDARLNYNKEGSNSGWHKIAWAFIKLVSKTGQLNTDQKLRLQLYKPKKFSIQKSSTDCILYDWWSKGVLAKYPSTLHICIKKVTANSLKETRHSDAVIKSEVALDFLEKNATIEEEIKEQTACEKDESVLKWSRIPSQTCKAPNNIIAKFKTAKKGCFGIKFSNNGLLIACGVADEEKSPIIVYSTLTKKEYCKLGGHQGIIYNLYWSSDDRFLISSSADCTSCLWDINKKQFYPKQILPHPAFVYCALMNDNLHIITGCYDQVIRIWTPSDSNIDSEFDLLQELDGHNAYITSLCFGEDRNVLFSSDSSGIIIEWNFKSNEWILQRTLQFKELQKTVINNIKLHPGGKRMIIFCRDSIHRMIDLTVGCIVQWYRGVLNYRIHTNGSLSPCGNLVLAPSEDGSIFFWNTDTGTLLSTYNPYSKIAKDTIVANYIDYHPFDHMVVISHYGSSVPILLCNYNARNEQRENACAAILQNLNLQKEMYAKNSKMKFKKGKNKTESNTSFDVIINKIDNLLVSSNNN